MTAETYGGIGFGIKREVFFLNLEDGYFGCQVNESTDVLQLFELSKLCDGTPNCFLGSDELQKELKCTDNCRKEDGTLCQNGVCLDNNCHCNDGYGGCSCEVPDDNECKYRPCDVFAHCTNTLGSFQCTCFPGYRGDGFHCEDINECDDPAIASRCVANAECCNVPAHFVCKCLPGYHGDGEIACLDIDECAKSGVCGRNALCHNTKGNYTCSCPDGYFGNPYDGCADLDECEYEDACGPGAICTNLDGSKQCTCPPGYRGDAYTKGCEDIDECAQHPCGKGSKCTNLEGTFSCTCPPGYAGNPLISCTDINECDSNPCAKNAKCINTNGTFSCLCPEGYTGYAQEECIDINECGRSNSCGINAKCINLLGSYKCVCPLGFKGQGQIYCENVNECETNPCGENAVCKDTIGSFVCSCKEDFTGDPFRGCVDINECVALEKPCGNYAVCENSIPGYNCICPQGYRANPSPQVACEQIDVNILCKSNFDCTNNAECIENQCFCQKGFVPQGATCTDINECETQPCGPFAICTNTVGGFQCDCDNGYVGSPPRIQCKAPCEDVRCGQHAHCKPDGQEAYCICEDGWTFNPSDISAGCIDINECDNIHGPNGRCGINAICTNSPGSFACHCPEGYTGNPAMQCIDIDECMKPNSCGSGAVCKNVAGSYTCKCPEGTIPDPDPYTKCNEIVKCKIKEDCPGNAICNTQKQCICPEPNIGNDCRHPCESEFCGPNQHCMLLNHEPKCICSAGYTGTHTGCVDIDECTANPCSLGAICKNEPGSFICECPGGTSGDPYRFGCSKIGQPMSCSAMNPCPTGEQCVTDDYIGQSACICVQGYTRDKTTGGCRDINECTDLRDKPACGLNAVCKNLPGSYDCQCPPGFNGNPFSECIECNSPECRCQPPYKLMDGNCVLAGCSKGESCPPGAECITITGGVSYCACPKGYRTLIDGSCQDINECAENQVCGFGAECLNTPGAYECRCPSGYDGDPYINHCAPAQKRCINDNDCLANEKCVQPGECICPPPFFTNLQDGSCRNPCERFPCGINAKCTPSDPPKCMCLNGFKGDPFQGCIDVDECADNPCAYAAHCLNQKGGYKCVCPKGMTGDPYKSGCILDLNGSSKTECSTNNDCANTLACVDGTCISPCGALLCGSHAYCEPENHAAWCRCSVGYTKNKDGECVSLCDGYLCASGAQCIVTNTGPTCKCIEGFSGNPFPGGECTTDVCSSANPCTEPSVCIAGRCKERCEGIVCGIDAHCDLNTNKCVCRPSFIGNPDLICIPPIEKPICQPTCGYNAHCEYGIMNQCVCDAGTTGNPYTECNVVEKLTCALANCGIGAKCKEQFNNVECYCPPGYNGNPYIECLDINECNINACGESAVCINTPGSYDCRCKKGYAGNPFVLCSKMDGGICLDAESCKCSHEVLCPSGFICDKGHCRNVCEDVRCGPKALCDAGHCICPPGFIGNPNDLTSGCKQRKQCNSDANCLDSEICFQLGKGLRKCVDACSKVQCGPNALCISENHRSLCICAPEYKGNPSDLIMGCQLEERKPPKECDYDVDCPPGAICDVDLSGTNKCVNPCATVACGLHESCQLDNFKQPVCHCKSEYLWNPITSSCEKPSVPDCKTNSECQTIAKCIPDPIGVLKCTSVCSQFTCPSNAICVAEHHKGDCQCLPGFTGNPKDRSGCQPILQNQCTSDVQCPEHQNCRKQGNTETLACQPACDIVKCGPNAVCIVNNHVAQCQCPPGPYVGDPNDLRSGCKTVPCVYNIDCPPNQLCNRLTHTCTNVCEEDSCGVNAVCISEGHRAVCQCPPGFHANPVAEVECKLLEVCNPNPCHSSAICEATSSGHICKCPANMIGDPVTAGCRPEGECPNGNSDCPLQSVCQNGRCINPCDQLVCGPNAVCTIANRKSICICPAPFLPGPHGPKNGCVRISISCTTDLDCGNEVCFNGQCKAVCRNNEDCLYGERCLQKMCMVPCIGHSQCRDNQACINGMCLLGCRSNKNCPPDQACINNKCQNPCDQEGVCGPNAICDSIQHSTTCKCPIGFQGNPTPEQGCVRVPTFCAPSNECPAGHKCITNQCLLPCHDNLGCASGERCLNSNCVKVCYGDSNCLPGELCKKGVCRLGCDADSDCNPNQICIESNCRCATGFITLNNECVDVNECSDSPCHKSAKCVNNPGSFRCVCPDRYIGDPFMEPGCTLPKQCIHNANCGNNLACYEGRCIDPCAEAQCAENAICSTFGHNPTCACLSGFLGDPLDHTIGCFKVECITNGDCSSDRYCNTNSNKCMNPCDSRDCGKGSCYVENHVGLCSCLPGYTLKQGICSDINECISDGACHKSAICQNSMGGFTCVCAEGLVGDPFTSGCRKPGDCFTDGDCPSSAFCINNLCKNPCEDPKTCGRNAECVPEHHAPTCRCPPQTRGNPHVECEIIECTDSNDCIIGKACIESKCVDPCSLSNVCGKNADCVTANHVAICTCHASFTGDPHLGCIPVLYCASDNQCPGGSKCAAGVCTSICTTSRECIQDQLCIQDLCQPTCKSNSSCPEFQYCSNSICIQELKCHSDNECAIDEKCIKNSIGQAECAEVCNGHICGRNAECTSKNHQPICNCKIGHRGNPNDDKIGCQKIQCESDSQCTNDKLCDHYMCKIACLVKNPCGKNALCSAERHKQVCYCQPGYTGDAYKSCHLIDFCANAPCGPGATCHNSHGSFRCQCSPGYVGDPYNEGCQIAEECNLNRDCPIEAKCVKVNGVHKCKDVCQNTVCGPNSECVANNHQGQCICRNGFEGDAKNTIQGCTPKPVLCHSTEDCPVNTYCRGEICRSPCQEDSECNLNEKCTQGQCLDPCDLKSSCGVNAVCKVSNHIKQCSCPEGFMGKEDVECIRSPTSCSSNEDCINGLKCQNEVCVPHCTNDNDCAYNEKCLKNTCILTCRVDNDCFLGHICLNNKCVLGCHSDEDCSASESCRNNHCENPCSESPCGPNAICTVSNHRATCSCGPNFVPNPTAKVACVRQPAQACTENRECQYGTTCVENFCKTVCSSDHGCFNNERCDIQTKTCKTLCRRDDDCRTGEICESLLCVTGCRSDHDCSSDRTCVQNKCLDPCLSPTICGTNAKCKSINHKAICMCPQPLTGNPFESCKPLLITCLSNSDCSSGHTCYGNICQQICKNDQNCLSDEKCIKGTCKLICNSDSTCGVHQICENRLCDVGCRSDHSCQKHEACINNKCQDPCKGYTSCGTCADCRVTNHVPQCGCPSNYLGNPLTSCKLPVVRCDGVCKCDEAGYCLKSCRSGANCLCGEVCKNGQCRAICSATNPCAAGQICRNGSCFAGCKANNDCSNDQFCINGKCENPCGQPNSCGRNALCKVTEHHIVCLCPDGYQGEPSTLCTPYECRTDGDCEINKKCGRDGACKNPCLEKGACGINAQCKVDRRKTQCSCPPGYIGNAKIECKQSIPESCSKNSCGENAKCKDVTNGYECSCAANCNGDPYKECVCEEPKLNLCKDQLCGVNAKCKVFEGKPQCYCPSEYPLGDPTIECSLQAESVDCRTEGCGKNAECIREQAVFVCRCPPGTTGRPEDECYRDAECNSDSDCPNEKACINFQCIDPCSLRGACGLNALCQTVLHRPRCSCPHCHIGMANTACYPDLKCDNTPSPPLTVLCVTNDDCPTTLACNSRSGECYSPCKSPSFKCKGNKKCEVHHHRATCVCKNGFVVNEYGEISCASDSTECLHDTQCASNLACIEGRCQNPCTSFKKAPCPPEKSCDVLNHRPICICMKDCSPSLSICLRDSGCPSTQACRAFRCEDPCASANCPADTPCFVEDHRPICKFCPPGFMSDTKYGCLKADNTTDDACTRDADCTQAQSCIKGICVDLCANKCGKAAICQAQAHKVVCSCPTGYEGNASIECYPIVETNTTTSLLSTISYTTAVPKDIDRTTELVRQTTINPIIIANESTTENYIETQSTESNTKKTLITIPFIDNTIPDITLSAEDHKIHTNHSSLITNATHKPKEITVSPLDHTTTDKPQKEYTPLILIPETKVSTTAPTTVITTAFTSRKNTTTVETSEGYTMITKPAEHYNTSEKASTTSAVSTENPQTTNIKTPTGSTIPVVTLMQDNFTTSEKEATSIPSETSQSMSENTTKYSEETQTTYIKTATDYTVPVVTLTQDKFTTSGKESTTIHSETLQLPTEITTKSSEEPHTPSIKTPTGYTVPVVTMIQDKFTTTGKEGTTTPSVTSELPTKITNKYSENTHTTSIKTPTGYTVPVVTMTQDKFTTSGKEGTTTQSVTSELPSEITTEYSEETHTTSIKTPTGYTVPVVTMTQDKITTSGKEGTTTPSVTSELPSEITTEYSEETHTTSIKTPAGYTIPVVTVTPEHHTTSEKQFTTSSSAYTSTSQFSPEITMKYSPETATTYTKTPTGYTVPVVTMTQDKITSSGKEGTTTPSVTSELPSEITTVYSEETHTTSIKTPTGYTVPVVTMTQDKITTSGKEGTTTPSVTSELPSEITTEYSEETHTTSIKTPAGYTIPVVTVTPEHHTTSEKQFTTSSSAYTSTSQFSPEITMKYSPETTTTYTKTPTGYTVPVVTMTQDKITSSGKEGTTTPSVTSELPSEITTKYSEETQTTYIKTPTGYTVPVVTLTQDKFTTSGKEGTTISSVTSELPSEITTKYSEETHTTSIKTPTSYTIPVVTVTPEHHTTSEKEFTTASSAYTSTSQFSPEITMKYSPETTTTYTKTPTGYTVPVVTMTQDKFATSVKEGTTIPSVTSELPSEITTEYSEETHTTSIKTPAGYTIPVVTVTPEHHTTSEKQFTTSSSAYTSTSQFSPEITMKYSPETTTTYTKTPTGYTVPVVTMTQDKFATSVKEGTTIPSVTSELPSEITTEYSEETHTTSIKTPAGYTIPVVTVTPEHHTTSEKQFTTASSAYTSTSQFSPEITMKYSPETTTTYTKTPTGYTVPVVTMTQDKITTSGKEGTTTPSVTSELPSEITTEYSEETHTTSIKTPAGYTIPVVTVTPEHHTTSEKQFTTSSSAYTSTSQFSPEITMKYSPETTTPSVTSELPSEITTEYSEETHTTSTKTPAGYTIPVVTVTPEHHTTSEKQFTTSSSAYTITMTQDKITSSGKDGTTTPSVTSELPSEITTEYSEETHTTSIKTPAGYTIPVVTVTPEHHTTSEKEFTTASSAYTSTSQFSPEITMKYSPETTTTYTKTPTGYTVPVVTMTQDKITSSGKEGTTTPSVTSELPSERTTQFSEETHTTFIKTPTGYTIPVVTVTPEHPITSEKEFTTEYSEETHTTSIKTPAGYTIL
ncbi:hypothetical protein FQA39_LY14353 [Lamprigera yunnana]|nr:hypothetical protein FQA39_LY14353 [Lamprigera yunnana]